MQRVKVTAHASSSALPRPRVPFTDDKELDMQKRYEVQSLTLFEVTPNHHNATWFLLTQAMKAELEEEKRKNAKLFLLSYGYNAVNTMWNRALENMKAWLQSPEAKLVNKLEAQLSEKHPMSMARWLLLLPAAVPKYQKWRAHFLNQVASVGAHPDAVYTLIKRVATRCITAAVGSSSLSCEQFADLYYAWNGKGSYRTHVVHTMELSSSDVRELHDSANLLSGEPMKKFGKETFKAFLNVAYPRAGTDAGAAASRASASGSIAPQKRPGHTDVQRRTKRPRA